LAAPRDAGVGARDGASGLHRTGQTATDDELLELFRTIEHTAGRARLL
jgi:hypothetical protein